MIILTKSKQLIIMLFLIGFMVLTLIAVQPPVAIAEDSKFQNHAQPDWMHPARRKDYEGYAKKKQQQRESNIWKYATNRPGGQKNQSGGTTEYKDYKPLYEPAPSE